MEKEWSGNVKRKDRKIDLKMHRKPLRGVKWKCDKRPFGEINPDFKMENMFFILLNFSLE